MSDVDAPVPERQEEVPAKPSVTAE